MIFSAVILIFVTYALNCKSIEAVECQFDRVEIHPNFIDGIFNTSSFRIHKFNHTAYVFSGDGTFHVDIDANFEVEVNFFYNRLNNNQYTRTALHIPRGSFCGMVDRYYPQYAMKIMKDCSNMPQYTAPTKFCPLKKVNLQRIESALA